MRRIKPHRRRKYRFPWRGGNRFELLLDGNRFFPEMLAAIEDAKESVELEMYLFESGVVATEFINSLCSASQRQVAVRLLLDDFGSLKLMQSDKDRLKASGVEVRHYNPLRWAKFIENMARDHRKLLIVDNRIAFAGGAGITDEFDPPLNPARRWRETMVAIRGQVVADWRSLFDDVWGLENRINEVIPPAETAGTMRGRVTVGNGRLFRDISRVLVRQVNRAQHRVWISTAYFVPSFRLRKSLRKAAGRGVDVRLLLPGPETDHPRVRIAGREFYTPLLKAGVRIFEFQPRVLHSKVMLCDQWVSVGSSNFDRWNLRWNLEANQEIEDDLFNRQARQMFDNDFADSKEITRSDWLNRGWRDRLAEKFWGWVELWVIRLGGGKWKD